MKRIISTALAFIVAFAVTPVSAQTPTPACLTQHQVVAGDTLFKLGIKYKVDWPSILYANGIKDVLNLKIGSILCIPASTVTPTITAPTATATVTPSVTTTASPTLSVTPTITTTATVTATVTVTSTPIPSLSKIPIFTIASVVPSKSVTINASSFPPNDNFDVTMGAMGTRGVGGTVVGRTNSGNGSFSATYTIPDAYAKSAQIAIRLQSPFTGFYSFNWFYNN